MLFPCHVPAFVTLPAVALSVPCVSSEPPALLFSDCLSCSPRECMPSNTPLFSRLELVRVRLSPCTLPLLVSCVFSSLTLPWLSTPPSLVRVCALSWISPSLSKRPVLVKVLSTVAVSVSVLSALPSLRQSLALTVTFCPWSMPALSN